MERRLFSFYTLMVLKLWNFKLLNEFNNLFNAMPFFNTLNKSYLTMISPNIFLNKLRRVTEVLWYPVIVLYYSIGESPLFKNFFHCSIYYPGDLLRCQLVSVASYQHYYNYRRTDTDRNITGKSTEKPTHINKAAVVEESAEVRARERQECVESWKEGLHGGVWHGSSDDDVT